MRPILRDQINVGQPILFGQFERHLHRDFRSASLERLDYSEMKEIQMAFDQALFIDQLALRLRKEGAAGQKETLTRWNRGRWIWSA